MPGKEKRTVAQQKARLKQFNQTREALIKAWGTWDDVPDNSKDNLYQSFPEQAKFRTESNLGNVINPLTQPYQSIEEKQTQHKMKSEYIAPVKSKTQTEYSALPQLPVDGSSSPFALPSEEEVAAQVSPPVKQNAVAAIQEETIETELPEEIKAATAAVTNPIVDGVSTTTSYPPAQQQPVLTDEEKATNKKNFYAPKQSKMGQLKDAHMDQYQSLVREYGSWADVPDDVKQQPINKNLDMWIGSAQDFELGDIDPRTHTDNPPVEQKGGLRIVDPVEFEEEEYVDDIPENMAKKAAVPTGMKSLSFEMPEDDMTMPYKALGNKPIIDEGGEGWGDLTTGTKIGAIAGGVANLAQMGTTIFNRLSDTKNTNAFKNYGERALKKVGEAKQFAGKVLDNQMRDIRLNEATTRKNFRNSARGINQLRAGEMSAHINTGKQERQAYNDYYNRMSPLFDKEASMMLDQDAKVMQGEYTRDLADRQDRDAYASSMSSHYADMGKYFQTLGKDANTAQENSEKEGIIKEMSGYGYHYDRKTKKMTYNS